MKNEFLPFWEHIDILRKILFRIIIVLVVLMTVIFCFKDTVFGIVLAPHNPDFITFRWLNLLANRFSISFLQFENREIELINTQLAAQLFIHLKVTCYGALVLASPYIVLQLFSFISPALYGSERKYSLKIILSAFLLFFSGVLVSYYIIFPFSFRFLAEYQVHENIHNMLNLSSYIDTFMMLTLLFGLVCEIPIVAWFLAKMGILSYRFMKKYRKHTLVIILIIAAIITPTTDIFTLLLVSFPILLLYELSVYIVKGVEKKKNKSVTKYAPVQNRI